MSTQYKLINPYIKGTFDSDFSGNTPDKAALKCWNALSKHFANNVPKFGFTLQNVQTGGMSHYTVKEDRDRGEVKYTIKKAQVEDKDEKILERQIEDIKNDKMKGGKRKHRRHSNDNDDDDSSSSSDYYKYNKYSYKYPISWFWYNPQLYRYPSVFIPSFNIPSAVSSSWYPYVEVQLANLYYI